MQELLEILEAKILPCNDDNSYVYGMNVAHANLIYNIKNGLLEKEKEQIRRDFKNGCKSQPFMDLEYYKQSYIQNKQQMEKQYITVDRMKIVAIEEAAVGKAINNKERPLSEASIEAITVLQVIHTLYELNETKSDLELQNK